MAHAAPVSSELLASAKAGNARAFEALVEPHRRELRAYCYRMSGALSDADDLVQESLVRAWRGLPSFEGRASLRTWLYRVAWSTCVDALDRKPARLLPLEEGSPADPADPPPAPRPGVWLEPCPESLYADEALSPEARVSGRESVGLAFLAALQLLPPRQRATLIAREVLGWSAEECATALDSTVASVNSSLQRARDTLEARAPRWQPKTPDEASKRTLLARYVSAWESSDVAALTSLLREDATLSMPPLPMWLRGPRAIGLSLAGMVLGPGTEGVFRLLATEANGLPAFGMYERQEGGAFAPRALHVLSLGDEGIESICAFLDPRLPPAFGLPESV